MKKRHALILIIVLLCAFIYSASASSSASGHVYHRPVIKCITEFGNSYDLSAGADGTWACGDEHCFLLDLCRDESRLYECCYRYKDGECSCWCKIRGLCI